MRPHLVRSLLALTVVALVACDKGDDQFDNVTPVAAPKGQVAPVAPVADNLPSSHPPIQGGDTPTGIAPLSPEEFGKTGALRWTAPDGWQPTKPASSMRLAEYVIVGQPEPAELSIFYFGATGGGGVEANISRWVGQFRGEGSTPKRSEEVINGMKVYHVDAAGTFDAGMAGGNVPPKEGQRMLGAIAESPVGLYFFKLVGPQELIAASEGDWRKFVASFTPGT